MLLANKAQLRKRKEIKKTKDKKFGHSTLEKSMNHRIIKMGLHPEINL